jgi:hypothetical protein
LVGASVDVDREAVAEDVEVGSAGLGSAGWGDGGDCDGAFYYGGGRNIGELSECLNEREKVEEERVWEYFWGKG